MNEFRNVDANEWVCTKCQDVVRTVPKPSKKHNPASGADAKRVCGLCGSSSLILAGTEKGMEILSPLGTEVLGKLKNPPPKPAGIFGVIGTIIVLAAIVVFIVSKVGIPTPEPVKEPHELSAVEKQALERERQQAAVRKKLLENQTKVLNYFQPKAEKGDDYAQYRLGMIYLNGEGVTNDLATARAWLEKAAAQGQPDAKKALANGPLAKSAP